MRRDYQKYHLDPFPIHYNKLKIISNSKPKENYEISVNLSEFFVEKWNWTAKPEVIVRMRYFMEDKSGYF